MVNMTGVYVCVCVCVCLNESERYKKSTISHDDKRCYECVLIINRKRKELMKKSKKSAVVNQTEKYIGIYIYIYSVSMWFHVNLIEFVHVYRTRIAAFAKKFEILISNDFNGQRFTV
jgi:hypothetical protein